MAREPRLSSVVVGNMGTVYAGDNTNRAEKTYNLYVQYSKDGYGRAAGEDVTWFVDGEIHEEYIGTLALESWEVDDDNIYNNYAEKGE